MKNAILILILLVILFSGCNPATRGWEYYTSSVVLIENDGRHAGSGFVVASDLIITARHVVNRGGNHAILFEDGTRCDVQAIRISKISECAVLLVHKTGLRPLRLYTKVQLGESVTVIGSPLRRKYFNHITRGIVSKLDVQENWSGSNPAFMVDAAINGGNSGGPVLNGRGKVIGIVVSSYLRNNEISFITPAADLIALLEEWKNEGANWDERFKKAEEESAEEYEASVGNSR